MIGLSPWHFLGVVGCKERIVRESQLFINTFLIPMEEEGHGLYPDHRMYSRCTTVVLPGRTGTSQTEKTRQNVEDRCIPYMISMEEVSSLNDSEDDLWFKRCWESSSFDLFVPFTRLDISSVSRSTRSRPLYRRGYGYHLESTVNVPIHLKSSSNDQQLPYLVRSCPISRKKKNSKWTGTYLDTAIGTLS